MVSLENPRAPLSWMATSAALCQGVGDVNLGHRHLLAGMVALIELPGGVHGQQAADLDLLGDLAELDLDALAVRELDAEALAIVHIGLGDLHAALGLPEPAHAVGEPRRTETHLGDAQAVAHIEENVVVVDFEAVEFELAVAAMLLRPHDADA